MSMLSDFSKGKLRHLPNAVHGTADDAGRHRIPSARRMENALHQGAVHTLEYYNPDTFHQVEGHVEEDEHTVKSKQQDREERPLG